MSPAQIAAAAQQVSSRRLFLKWSSALAIAGGTAAVLAGSIGAPRWAAASTPALSPAGQAGFFKEIRHHEDAHVTFLLEALGDDARPEPTFQGLEQSNYASFVSVAQALENTGCGAYLGAAPAINSREYLAAAGSIALIEARHAGYINTYMGDPITGDAANDDSNNNFELPLTAAQVATNAGSFISSLNDGPALTYSNTPSDDNDIAILNFALALEYLEANFYAANVPKYFG